MTVLALVAAVSLAAPPGPAEGPEPFTCCDHPQIEQIVDRYVDLVETVADGERDGEVSAHAYALRGKLKPHPTLDPEENAVIRALEAQVDRVRNQADAIRAELGAIGRSVIFLALRHEGGSLTVVEALCPDRGPWLQRSTTAPKSPWGGSCARWR